jgi:S-adenosylmethionine/arginine decarboxylase-like enzyme
MFHYLFDAYDGYRSRLDDLSLVHEFLEEVPLKLGLRTVMPPFVLPYYNGVVPEDCGISAFVFLSGGHFTLHTFSYRGAYFIDLLYPRRFSPKKLRSHILDVLPSGRTLESFVDRTAGGRPERPAIDARRDFGPHLMLDIEDYAGPGTMDEVFGFLDGLPGKIGMTPIIRPYVLRNGADGQEVLSGMTMIAESHIALHVFRGTGTAFFDIFSCSFFDPRKVRRALARTLKGRPTRDTLISRGSKYKESVETPVKKVAFSRAWLNHAFAANRRR